MNKQEIEIAIEIIASDKKAFESVNHGGFTNKIKAFELAISALEQQLTNGWMPVSERLPKNEKRVLICAERKLYNGKLIQIITTAMHEDGTLLTTDSDLTWEDCDFEYCEKADDYIIPKGWYEQNMYCEVFGVVDDFVIAWQPLPEAYKEVSDAKRD